MVNKVVDLCQMTSRAPTASSCRCCCSAGSGRSSTSCTPNWPGDDADRRRKLARLTPRGIEVLALSAMIVSDIRSRWADTLGEARLSELEAGLRTMVPGETFRLDVPGWFGA